VQRMIALTVNS